MTQGTYRFTVGESQSGLRLDLFLSAVLDDIARGLVKRLIELGGVHVDGRRIRRCSLPVSVGQRIELYVDGLPLEPFQLDPTRILFQDRYLLAIDKPAGVATQPTPARYQGTLYAALLQYLGTTGRGSLGMVQRLDRDTSGVIVFSIHPRAHKGLTAVFTEHRVVKRYLALTSGVPPQCTGEIRSMLARRHATNRMVSVEHGGKLAVTRYRTVASFADAALLEVEIPTGRSHQIRVHLAEAGHPLLGDPAYGGPTEFRGMPIGRQMLHASELQFEHPVGRTPLRLVAPLAGDFQALLDILEHGADAPGSRANSTPVTT